MRIVPDDGQQAAMQDTDLFTKHPPDNEQRLDQHGHIGEVFDELLDARPAARTNRLPLAAAKPAPTSTVSEPLPLSP
jgi:hypothetical protein